MGEMGGREGGETVIQMYYEKNLLSIQNVKKKQTPLDNFLVYLFCYVTLTHL